jgi:N-glycosidase YbiA
MSAVYFSHQNPAVSGFDQFVTTSKNIAVTAASVGTVAGAAIYLGPPYAVAAAALLGTAYLIRSCISSRQQKIPTMGAVTHHSSSWIAQQQAAPSALIAFYDHSNPATEWLGNFYETPIQYNGLMYRNSEAAYQAQKFIKYPSLMQRLTALSGPEAFSFARDNRAFWCSDWQQIKVQKMADVLKAKFQQNPKLGRWLLDTGNAYLVEHNPVKGRDRDWSDDFDGSGKNMLGILLMQERSYLGGMGVVPKMLVPVVLQGGTGAVQMPVPSVVHVAQQTQQTANRCLVMGCSRPRYLGEFFCGRTHGQAFKASYIQKKQVGQCDCDYPGCGKPRNPGFDYCGRSHGQIMDGWKRKNQIQ